MRLKTKNERFLLNYFFAQTTEKLEFSQVKIALYFENFMFFKAFKTKR